MSAARSLRADGAWRWVRWCIWAGCALLAGVLALSPATQTLDNQLHDAYSRWLPAKPPPPEVMLVDIDERSLAMLGPWPWPRPVLARLSETLRQRGAKLQVWDVLFPNTASGDALLDRSIAHPDTVISQVLVLDPAVEHPPHDGTLRPATGAPGLCSDHAPVTGYMGVANSLRPGAVGHATATPSADGRLRKLPAVICHEGQAYPQLALAAAQASNPGVGWELLQGRWPWEPHQTLVRGAWRFPLDEKGWLNIPYARPHSAWPAISAAQLLEPGATLPPLEGRIVLVGATALGLADVASTPFHPHAPGMSVHAELLGAAGSPSQWQIRPWAAPWFAALWVFCFGWIFWKVKPYSPPRNTLASAALVLLCPALLALLLRPLGLVMPVWAPMLALLVQGGGWLALQSVVLRQESQRLARHLQSFMPTALASQIASQNPTSDSLGQPCQGTLLALHVTGLERWVASVETLQALGLIHGIYATAQALAAQRGGRLEHAQGHTLILAWPDASAESVKNSLAVAEKCAQELTPLLVRNESHTHPLSVHIAIETGLYLIGVVGNTASRRSVLLGPAATDVQAILYLSGELASTIIVGPSAAALVAPQAPLQRLGRFVLPEQAQPKELYRHQPPVTPSA